jgi:plastocyanin
MDSLRACAFGLAVGVAILCSAPRPPLRAQAAPPGIIRGKVHVVSNPARRLSTAGVYPGRIVGIQADRDTSELDNVIVFLNTAAPEAVAPRRVTIRQTNEEFVPHVVGIAAGSTVDFPNDDLIFHNVFSLSRAATFDLGRYPRNASKSRTFTKPGIVKVFCHLHSHMSALIRVFPHPYFVVPDRDGRFSMADVPPGRHSVTAWHERAGEVSQTAVISDGGTTELTFSLPLTDTE